MASVVTSPSQISRPSQSLAVHWTSAVQCRCAAGICVAASAADRRSHAAPAGNRGQVQGGAQAPVTTRARKQEEQLHGSANNTLQLHRGVSCSTRAGSDKQEERGLCPVARIRGTVPPGMAVRITRIEMIGSGCQQISMGPGSSIQQHTTARMSRASSDCGGGGKDWDKQNRSTH